MSADDRINHLTAKVARMTCNDQPITEMLIRIAQLHQVVSAHVRAGHLAMALTKGSELEDVARKLNWRIHDVGYKPKGTT